jgi:maleylacetate reductase
MSGFSYQLRPARILFRDGAAADIPSALRRAGYARAFVVCTPGRAGVLETLLPALGAAVAGAFTGARPHVPSDTIAEARALLDPLEADCCIAIGGGSAIGLGKALALETGLPLIAVPTTYSGSEMTDIWGITLGDAKKTGRSAQVAPRLVIYDPELSRGLPGPVSAASGLNGAAHAVEALYAPDAHPLASLAAERALALFARALPRIAADGEAPGARRDALEAGHLAGFALGQTSMGLHHKLCHVLGGSFGLPHAETHAALLPHVVAFNQDHAPGAMARVASALGTAHAAGGLDAIAHRIGMRPSLRELGLNAADLERAADLATETAYANPRPVTREGVLAVLRHAFEGHPIRRWQA